MTPLAQSVANLPEEQLNSMVTNMVTGKICRVITDKSGTLNKKDEIEKIRSEEVISFLSNTGKDKVNEMCDKELDLVDAYHSLGI